jgi:hypothetical protein
MFIDDDNDYFYYDFITLYYDLIYDNIRFPPTTQRVGARQTRAHPDATGGGGGGRGRREAAVAAAKCHRRGPRIMR